MAFDDLNDTFESAPLPSSDGTRARANITAAQFAALPHPEIPCGLFTLGLTDGSTKRFRIRVERGRFLTGKRSLALHQLVEDPPPGKRQDEWQTIAALNPNGFGMFHGFKNGYEARWAAALFALLRGEPAGGYSLVEVDRRCWLTMRALTDDAARRTGLCKAWRVRLGVE
jgi:hypothetical protein